MDGQQEMTMRAIGQDDFGGPEVLKVIEAERPEPGPAEVLVRVHAAAGGVGHLAVQIAKARGAHVIGTARTAKHEFLRGLGADELIDYTETDFEAVVEPVDVVIDTIGGAYGPRSLKILRPGGILVSLASPAEAYLAEEAAAVGRRAVFMIVEADQAGLRQVAELVEAGLLRPEIDRVFPLEGAVEAHELSDAGRTTGKIVLSLKA
ncbi:zinc-binding dehydrogenase [Actinomadura sp. ATCC 39365]